MLPEMLTQPIAPTPVKFGSLKPTLAIGLNGSKHLKLRSWNGAAERALAAMRDARRALIKNKPMLNFSVILASLVAEVGNKVLWTQENGVWTTDMKDDERIFLFDECHLEDIKMMLFFIRRETYGNEFSYLTLLPGREEKSKIDVDLDDFDVTIVESHEVTRREHKFKCPVMIRSEEATHCILGAGRWGAMTSLTSSNASTLAYGAIFSSVFEIPGTRIRQPTATDFDEVSRPEIERLAKAVDAIEVGLDLRVYIALDDGTEHTSTVIWLDPDFFTDSSLFAVDTRSGKTSSRSSTSVDSLKT